MPHNCRIEFPNGRGYTPCTPEYVNTYDTRNGICNPTQGGQLGDLSAEDYQEWSRLDDLLNNLQLSGHLGKSVIY